MIHKVSVSALALSSCGTAAPAIAQTNIIHAPDPASDSSDTLVREISSLEITKGAGQMVIENKSDNTMGNPTSGVATPTDRPITIHGPTEGIHFHMPGIFMNWTRARHGEPIVTEPDLFQTALEAKIAPAL